VIFNTGVGKELPEYIGMPPVRVLNHKTSPSLGVAVIIAEPEEQIVAVVVDSISGI
jgi:hypothetical protein